mgnify:CR=1 FL=1
MGGRTGRSGACLIRVGPSRQILFFEHWPKGLGFVMKWSLCAIGTSVFAHLRDWRSCGVAAVIACFLLVLVGCTEKPSPTASDESDARQASHSKQTSTAVLNKTTSLRVTPEVLDFGVVRSGRTLTGTFKLTNDAATVSHVTDVKTSCGCTTADKPPEMLESGESTELRVRFRPTGRHGAIVQKRVTVVSERRAPVFAHVKATVKEYIVAEPRSIDLSNKASQTVMVRATDKTEFTITAIEPAWLTRKTHSQAATTHQLTIDKSKWQQNPSPAAITIHVDHPKVDHFHVGVSSATPKAHPDDGGDSDNLGDNTSVRQDSAPALRVLPRRFQLGPLGPSEPATTRVLVRGLDEGVGASHFEVAANKPGLSVRLQTANPAQNGVRLELRIATQRTFAQRTQFVLTITHRSGRAGRVVAYFSPP